MITLSGIYHSFLIPGSRLKIGIQESRFGLKIDILKLQERAELLSGFAALFSTARLRGNLGI